jgi:thiosulfate/3-mercaptopyruvate sulfurtransferase
MSRADVLVGGDWAEAHLDDPKVVFVEVDEDVGAYDRDHILGAIRIDWSSDLQQQIQNDLIDQATFEELMSSKGIARDDTVVLYGGNNNWFSAFAYWYFKLYGHPDVRLLDGGRKAWELQSRPLVTEVPQRPRTEYKAEPQRSDIRAFRDEVLTTIGASHLIDVRSPDEYAGRMTAPAHLPQEQGQKRGHIPTAVNIPWSRAAHDDGTFKTDDELRELYADVLAEPDKPVIAYCRIGERSAHTWFVLHELLAVKDTKNYDGSWIEYGALIRAPIEVGD